MLAPSTAKFAGYRVEGIAGRGGMGVVYKATQLGLDRPVALKVVAAGLLGDPRIRERFLRESRAAAAIEHPNVIPIHDYGECHGRAYIAMRFVDGDDLRERVTATGPLAPEHAAAIVAHVADALDAAHDAVRVLEVSAGVALIALAVLVPLGLLGAAGGFAAAALRRRRREAALSA